MDRIYREKQTVEIMVRMYCRHKEGNDDLCGECKALIEYAHRRLDLCRFGNKKPTCRKCPIHCYRKDMADKIRQVMRYSGPRMIIYHPQQAIRHIISELSHSSI